MTLSSASTVVGTNHGSDIITTGLGSALVLGGTGDDVIVTSAGAAFGTAAGANIILGDHGRVVFANPQTGANLPTLVETLFSTTGGNDVITTGAGNDLIIGGTGADRISDSAGNNLMFGDHASISGTIDPTRFLQFSAGYTISSAFTGATGGGGADVINGGSGNDLIVGGQGADTIYGKAGDDDIIGGHYLTAAQATSLNATASSDAGDLIDGGAGHDAILGDSGAVIRAATDVRLRVIAGATSVGTVAQANPDSPARTTWLFTSPTMVISTYGNDYIAGGAGNDMVFGQTGNDVIQGDGSLDLNRNGIADSTENLGVGAWSGATAYTKLLAWKASLAVINGQSAAAATGGVMLLEAAAAGGMLDYAYGSMGTPEIAGGGGGVFLTVKASLLDFDGTGTDGDDYIEGGSGVDTIFGNGGQDDIIGGSSGLFGGLIAQTGSKVPVGNLAGADVLFGGSGALNEAAPAASADGRAREGNVVVAGNATVLRGVSNGAAQYVDQGVSGPTANVVRRAVELLDGATANSANVTYMLAASAQDIIVKSTLGDVVFGVAGSAQMAVNSTGASVLSAKVSGVDVTKLTGSYGRSSPNVAKAAFASQAVKITVGAALTARIAKGVSTYTYNAATRAFEPITAATRKVTTGALKLTELSTATSGLFAYVDDKGGFWMVPTAAASALSARSAAPTTTAASQSTTQTVPQTTAPALTAFQRLLAAR
jgi:Ca2+-binding RTX toxin-like protein